MTEQARLPSEEESRRMDAEATEFAMHLLMPDEFLIPDVHKLGGVDMEDTAKVAKLAKKYQVSMQVMTIRLGMLMREPGHD